APHFWPGSSFSLTYFDISYSGRVDEANLTENVLSLPAFAWLVTRNFTQAQRDEVCAHSVFQGSAGTCASSSVGAISDNRLRNIALLKPSGIDVSGKYSRASRLGRFDLGLNGTYLFKYAQSNTPGSPLLNIVSTQNNPINFRARGSAGWSRRGLGLSTFVNFQ